MRWGLNEDYGRIGDEMGLEEVSLESILYSGVLMKGGKIVQRCKSMGRNGMQRAQDDIMRRLLTAKDPPIHHE